MASTYQPVIVVAGPTASGKSDLAQRVALALQGEVISADSMQIYRGMDIGTAKLSAEERAVPHHFLDIIDPGEPYSAQRFQHEARQTVADLQKQGKAVVIAGGTGFYIQALLEDMRFPSGEQQENPVREQWTSYLEEHGAQALWEELRRLDQRSAGVIHPNNSRRVIRALEMNAEGISYADQSANIKRLDAVIPSVRFCIQRDRTHLYERIESRVDSMFEDGLVAEVQTLLSHGLRDALTAQQAIGYKEVVRYLDGEWTLQQAKDEIKQATRRYAKRQISWFKRDPSLRMLDAESLTADEMLSRILEAYSDIEQETVS